MAEYTGERKYNWIRTTVGPKVLARSPLQRAIVELACPLSQIGKCPSSKSEWLCDTCTATIEYNLENAEIYCDCGSFPVAACTFRCCSEKHGKEFVPDLKLQERLNALKPVEFVNILILGETGVGKSTWINSIANYMTYSSFQEAQSAGKLLYLIPTFFHILDENDKKREIKVGKEDKTKEVFSDKSQSATQMPSSYVFRYGDLYVRLLDTPGVGDCRGSFQDQENFSHVMAYLANLECLHGICILLKPDEKRLDTKFKYCLTELLTQLHRSATDNIVFCVTNGRKSDFKFYQTEKPLIQAIQDCTKERGITIKVDKSTMFVLENESFQYLAAHYQGVKCSAKKIKKCEKSFTYTKNECVRLVSYLRSKSPHQLKSTISLNEAKNVITWMIKQMTEIFNNLKANKALFEVEKKKIIENGGKFDGEKIQAKQVKLVIKHLDTPASVCTERSCTEYFIYPETNEIFAIPKVICEYVSEFWQICDKYLSILPLYSFVGQLVTSNKCGICKHDKSLHIKTAYINELKTHDVEFDDLAALNDTIAAQVEAIASVNEYMEKFCKFLKIHSVVASDDAYADQIDKEIATAKLTPANSEEEKNWKQERLNNLISLKEEHELKRNSMSKQTGDSDCISPEEVFKFRDELYKIPVVAEYLKDTERATATANENLLKNKETICDTRSRILK